MKSLFYKTIFIFSSCTMLIFTAKAQKENPTATITVIGGLDVNCNKFIDKNEYGNINFTATINANGTTRSATANGNAGAVFSNMPFGTYSIFVAYNYTKDGTTQNLTTTTTATITNADGAFAQVQLFPNCDVAPPPPPPVILKCGQWQNTKITAQPFSNLIGNADVRNKETLTVTTLKTEIFIDLDYTSAPYAVEGKKDKVERCPITATLKYPNGNVKSFTNNYRFTIMAPGTYVITYQAKCGDNICESGSKVIVCNDPIVCNCAPANNNNLKVISNGQSTTGFIANGAAIIIDKNEKTTFTKPLNCDGNICEGYTDFKVVDATTGKIWDAGRIGGRTRFNAPNNGTYNLIITEYCGTKNCNTYTYPLTFIGQNKNEYYHNYVKGRWGIQIGYYRGFPSMERTTSTKGYGTGLIGLIADLPFSYAKRWHLWPAINLYSTNYRSKATQAVGLTPQPVEVCYKNIMAELSLDVSYAFPINKKSFLHVYFGGSASPYIKTTNKYTSPSAAAITNWKAANRTIDSIAVPGKFNLGLLYDINRNWVVGLNYYQMAAQKNDKILALTQDKGVGLRVAYFFNNNRK